MNKQTLPLLAKLSPVLAAAAPGLVIGVAVGGALLWLLSDGKKAAEPKPAEVPTNTTPPVEVAAPMNETLLILTKAARTKKRVRREDLAEALAYGARAMTRHEAVAELQHLGFGKTAAYNALSERGRFADLLDHSADGLIAWRG